MSFQTEVIGFRDLSRNAQAIARMMSGDQVAASLEEGALVVVESARKNAVAQGLFDKGELVKSIVPRKINQYRVDVVVKAVYGAAHEFGLPQQRITDKQRRFFWAMYSETKDSMWKALALSATYTIPARPYLRPAIDSGSVMAAAGKAVATELGLRIQRAVT